MTNTFYHVLRVNIFFKFCVMCSTKDALILQRVMFFFAECVQISDTGRTAPIFSYKPSKDRKINFFFLNYTAQIAGLIGRPEINLT